MLKARVLRIALCCVVPLALATPMLASSRLIAPLWDVYVVDESGKPVVGYPITEIHQDFDCEAKDHSETLFTDVRGHVEFHERYYVGNGAMCSLESSTKAMLFIHKGRHAILTVGDNTTALIGQNVDRSGHPVEWVNKPQRMLSRIVVHPRNRAPQYIPPK